MTVVNLSSCGLFGALPNAQVVSAGLPGPSSVVPARDLVVEQAPPPIEGAAGLSRRTFLTVALSTVATGCIRGIFTRVEEPFRLAGVDDLSAAQLDLHPGVTSPEDAQLRMRRRHLTGIVGDRYAAAEGHDPLLDVLTADYQSRIHIFRDGRYGESLELHPGNVIPYGFALNISGSATGTYLMVLYRDPLNAEAPRIELYRLAGNSFAYLRSINISQLVGRRGMTRPIFVGHNLDDGVLFLARDRNGDIWGDGYFLRLVNGRLHHQAVSIEQAAQCNCVQRYLDGDDGSLESLWRRR